MFYCNSFHRIIFRMDKVLSITSRGWYPGLTAPSHPPSDTTGYSCVLKLRSWNIQYFQNLDSVN